MFFVFRPVIQDDKRLLNGVLASRFAGVSTQGRVGGFALAISASNAKVSSRFECVVLLVLAGRAVAQSVIGTSESSHVYGTEGPRNARLCSARTLWSFIIRCQCRVPVISIGNTVVMDAI